MKLKLLIMTLPFIGFSLSSFGQVATAYGTHEDAIREVLKEAYIDGVFNEGNLTNIQQGFADEFKLFGLTPEGEIQVITKKDWLERVRQNQREGRYPATGSDFVRMEIRDIDVEQNTAMVKLNFYRGNKLEYIDFIGLYHCPSGWKIVSKTFTKVQ